jgi:ABC-2 type transport system permease protein
MLYQIFAITVKDLKILFRDRGGMIALFAMPIMFILVMSTALQGVFSVGGSDNPVEILVVNHDAGDLAAEAIAALQTVDGLTLIEQVDGVLLTREMAEQIIVDGEYQVALVFPTDFSDSILRAATDPEAEKATVTFIADPTTSTQYLGPIQGTVQGFIQRTAAYAQAPRQIEAVFADLASQSPPEQAPFVEQIGSAFVNQMIADGGLEAEGSDGVRFERVSPADFVVEEFPDAVEQNVPGYTIFGVFFIVQVLATSILREKQEGTFRRLLVAPLPRAVLLIGKLLPNYLVNLIQVASMFAVGVVVFGMKLGNDPLALAAVTLATAAAATGLGLLVATIGKTAEQISGFATLMLLTMAAVGGLLVPAFVMPGFMQTLSWITPHAWALAGYQDVIVRGLGLNAVFLETGVLLGFAVVFYGFAVWKFRFQ